MSCGVSTTSRPSLPASLADDLERAGVAGRIGVAQHVDRIAVAPGRRQERIEARARVGRQRRQLAAMGDERVGREHARTARVGDHGQPRSARPRLLTQHLRHVEDVADLAHAQHADAPKGRIEHLVRAGERARVRGGGARGRLGAPRLDDDDRLRQRHFARRREKTARVVADRLHVKDDRARARIVAEVVDEVTPTDVEHGPQRDEGTEPQLNLEATSRGSRSAARRSGSGTPRCLGEPSLPRTSR